MKNLNLKIIKGNSKNYNLTFRDNLKKRIDITGWIIYFTVKKLITDSYSDAKIKKVITEHTIPTSGQTTIILSSEDTNLSGTYIYDITVKNEEVTTILMGNIEFVLNVTDEI